LSPAVSRWNEARRSGGTPAGSRSAAPGRRFLVSQILALLQLVGQGVYLRGNPHSSLFYVMTGAHGAHLLGAMAFLAWLLAHARQQEYQAQGRSFGIAALFWHFLDALWLAVFAMLLLSR
jgi:cytochrome c oxidase subunit 3